MSTHLDAEANGDSALSVIKDLLEAGPGSEVVRKSLRRHYEHLEKLAASLRKLGMDEHEVDDSIMLIFREYETELRHYIDRI